MQQKVFNKTQLIKIIMTAILISLNVVLERFLAFQFQENHYTVSIITVVFAVVYLGTPYAVIIAAMGDILGAIIAPTGPYFPGFTATNIIVALCLALFLRKKVNILNTTASGVINKLLCTLALNTLWIAILYAKSGIAAYPAMFISRIPQAIIMGLIEIVVITLMFDNNGSIRKSLDKAVNKFLK